MDGVMNGEMIMTLTNHNPASHAKAWDAEVQHTVLKAMIGVKWIYGDHLVTNETIGTH